jgi:hypothetical protein
LAHNGFCPLPFPAAALNDIAAILHTVNKGKRQVELCKKNGAPEPVSNVSRDEEARLLYLADVALHKNAVPHEFLPAGTRAHREHQRIMQKVRDAVEHAELKKAA